MTVILAVSFSLNARFVRLYAIQESGVLSTLEPQPLFARLQNNLSIAYPELIPRTYDISSHTVIDPFIPEVIAIRNLWNFETSIPNILLMLSLIYAIF